MVINDQLGLFGGGGIKDSSPADVLPKDLVMTVRLSMPDQRKKIDELVQRFMAEVMAVDKRASVISDDGEGERPWSEQSFLALDVETTGLDPASNRVIEVAMVPFNMANRVQAFSQLFSIGEKLPAEITRITGISDAMLDDKPTFERCADRFIEFFERASFIVAYNAKFDRPFVESELARTGRVLPDLPWIDPFIFICDFDRYKRGKKLSDAAMRWGIDMKQAHRAEADARAAGDLLLKMAEKIDCSSLGDLLRKQKVLEWRNAHGMAELKRANGWAVNR